MKIIAAYLVAWLLGCVEISIAQCALVLTGLSKSKMFLLSVHSQNWIALFFIFLIGFTIDLPGPRVGIKRWNGLAIAFSVSVLLVMLMNLGPKPNYAFIIYGGIVVSIVLAIMYFTTAAVGERLYQCLSSSEAKSP